MASNIGQLVQLVRLTQVHNKQPVEVTENITKYLRLLTWEITRQGDVNGFLVSDGSSRNFFGHLCSGVVDNKIVLLSISSFQINKF